MKKFYSRLGSLALISMLSAGAASAQMTLTNIEPAAGVTFNYVWYDAIQVFFNEDVTEIGNVTVSFTSKETGELETVEMSGGYIFNHAPESSRFDININKYVTLLGGEVLPNFYETEFLPVADLEKGFFITLEDVKGESGPVSSVASGLQGVEVEDGTITISYTVDIAPSVDNEDWPETFYNYWPKGNEAGIATITFDMPIVKVEEVSLMMGQVTFSDGGGSSDEPDPFMTLPASIDGSQVIIDFTGINFEEEFAKNFVKPIGGYSTVTVLVRGVQAENGLYMVTNNRAGGIYTYIPFVNESYDGSEDQPGTDDPGTDDPGTDDPEGPTVGVDAIQNGANSFTVYNLQGVKVLENSESINNLRPGMYIVNGKKVVIRK